MKSKHLSYDIAFASSALALLILACGLFSTPAESTSAPVPAPTITVEALPEATKAPPPTPIPEDTNIPEPPACYRWDEVTLAMAGEKVCVYGVAYSHQGQSRIDFSSEPNSFFLIDPVYYYPNLSAGSCVVAEEVVEVFDSKIPFMTIKDSLYKCESWME